MKEKKIQRAVELARLADGSAVIGVFSLHKLPAATLLNIKRALTGTATLRVGRKSTLLHGLRQSTKNLSQMEAHISGPCGLIFSNMPPFALFKLIKASRAPVSAKAGELAPEDIVIPAGPTQLPPGPAISALQKAGLKTRVEGGKIVIADTKTICKAGQAITEDMVAVFALLKMAPLKKGLDVRVLWEDGVIYPRELLDIDVSAYIAELERCAAAALNLAINSGYPTPESIPLLLRKAYDGACAVCMQSGFIEPDLASDVLARAVAVAEAIKALAQE